MRQQSRTVVLALPGPCAETATHAPEGVRRQGAEQAELAVQTALAINRMDQLIAGRVNDLEILKALAVSLKAGAPKAQLHHQLLILARSSQHAFQSLQSSRDALVALHKQSSGGTIAPVVDKVTGLPNRSAFDMRLDDIFVSAQSTSDVVLMLLDIGSLALLSSQAGSRIADRVVRRFASILRKTVKRSDYIARVGPQQFGIVFEHILPENAATVALRIHEAMKARLAPTDDPLLQMLAVSITITGRKNEDTSSADLLQRASDCIPLARKQVGGGIYIA
jgi:diguanylate cyclase (GGDEF)-like protein